jgi:hypothetical protein
MATRNVTSTTAPWQPQQQYLKRGMRRAERNYGDFGRVADLHGYTREGLQGMAQEARQGTPGTDRALDYGMNFLQGSGPDQYGMQATAEGDYLNSNPYLDETINQALDPVQSRVNSQFAAGGRYGSGMHSSTMADELGDVSSRMAYQNYADERARQQQAQQALMSQDARFRDDQRQMASQLPSLEQAQYSDEAQLMQAGDVFRQQRQRELDRPQNQLGTYLGLVSGNYGSQSTQPYFRDETANTIGNISGAISAGTKGLDFISGVTDLFT